MATFIEVKHKNYTDKRTLTIMAAYKHFRIVFSENI